MSTQNPATPGQPAAPASPYDIECQYVATGPTTLRCSKCNRPLMTKDARHTPTGYVCPYYVKARIATFYNAKPEHYALVAVVAVVLGAIAGFVLRLAGGIGFFSIIITLFAGPAIGGLVAEAIRRVLGKVRGQYFWLAAAIAFVIGGAYFTVLPVLVLFLAVSPNALFALIPVVGLGLAVSTMIARMRI
jgi:hypothetical protein